MLVAVAVFAVLAMNRPIVPIVLPTPPASVALCRYIDAWRGTNVPVRPAAESTDIVHALAVARGDDPIGWLIFRRDGKIWYFDGPVRGVAPRRLDSVDALSRLGLQHHAGRDVGLGAMIPLADGAEISNLVESGFGLYTCY